MGEPNVNYNSKTKRETIRGTKREVVLGVRRDKRKAEEGSATRDGPGKERDEICLNRRVALCD